MLLKIFYNLILLNIILYRKNKRGGGGEVKTTIYAHMLPLNFVEKIFGFEGARPEKGLKI